MYIYTHTHTQRNNSLKLCSFINFACSYLGQHIGEVLCYYATMLHVSNKRLVKWSGMNRFLLLLTMGYNKLKYQELKFQFVIINIPWIITRVCVVWRCLNATLSTKASQYQYAYRLLQLCFSGYYKCSNKIIGQ